MSAELYCASELGGNNAGLQSTTVGGGKPLHRFMKGQPKLAGIVVLVLGSSFFIVSIAITPDDSIQFIWTAIPTGFVLGTLLIICGILYIITEHNTTKKNVTISLALSIVTVLMAFLTLTYVVPTIIGHHYFGDIDLSMDNTTAVDSFPESYETMGIALEHILLVYVVAGGNIALVMSCLAGAALRSTKNGAVIVMTATPAAPPAESGAQEEDLKCDTLS